jgi:DNA-binding NarL/FixJ family response regulator
MKPAATDIPSGGREIADTSQRGLLPARLSVLYVPGPNSPSNWLAKALETEPECQVQLSEASSLAGALERLREETYNVVLIDYDADVRDRFEWVDAVRAGSHVFQPVIILGDMPDSQIATECYEFGADAFVPVQNATPRELIWQIARATERERLSTENEQLRRRQQRQKTLERDETLKLICEQQSILSNFSGMPATSDSRAPDWLEAELRELLQAHVVMGSGNLRKELERFIQRVREHRVSRLAVAEAFSTVMRAVIEELGTRSSRHVYNRGNLLLLDLLFRSGTHAECCDATAAL